MIERCQKRKKPGVSRAFLEREKGFEPSTSTLARWHSTTELLPRREGSDYLEALSLSTRCLQFTKKRPSRRGSRRIHPPCRRSARSEGACRLLPIARSRWRRAAKR